MEIYNTKNADVLVLAGDIIVVDKLFNKGERHYLNDIEFQIKLNDRYHSFFQQVCEEFKNVIYVFGNHEYYHSDYATALQETKEKLSYLNNLHILEKESLKIDDVTFICGTMWTDFNGRDPLAMQKIAHRMNDFYLIGNNNRKQDPYLTSIWSPEDAYQDHLEFLDFARKELSNEENKNVVMITHHCPSSACIPEKYSGDTIMNPGYVSQLEEFILDNPKIKFWVCGHSHRTLDAMIGPTNILMNCRGYYGREDLADDFNIKYFDI